MGFGSYTIVYIYTHSANVTHIFPNAWHFTDFLINGLGVEGSEWLHFHLL